MALFSGDFKAKFGLFLELMWQNKHVTRQIDNNDSTFQMHQVLNQNLFSGMIVVVGLSKEPY